MSTRTMTELKDMLCDELEQYSRKTKMNMSDLDIIHKLTDTIKNIDKISMLEEQDGGYSGAGDWTASMRGSYGRYSRNNGNSYGNSYNDGGSSYARGRGYSRGDAKDYILEHLDKMLDKAETQKEREALERCITAMNNA